MSNTFKFYTPSFVDISNPPDDIPFEEIGELEYHARFLAWSERPDFLYFAQVTHETHYTVLAVLQTEYWVVGFTEKSTGLPEFMFKEQPHP